MNLNIHHVTRYRYSHPVAYGDQHVFVHPRPSHVILVDGFELHTAPASRQRWVRDAFNNIVLVAQFGMEPAEELVFDARIRVRTLEDNPYNFVLEPYATGFPFSYEPRERIALAPAIETPIAGSSKVLDWLQTAVPSPDRHADVVRFLGDINAAVRAGLRYESRDAEGIRTPDETLRRGSGSCRDMALLFIAICRQIGLAARFVSGYLYDSEETGGAGFNRAAGSLHAWAEVYLPGAGWKGFDPTNGILANNTFVPSAVAIDPVSINPIQGRFFSREPATSSMEVFLEISAISP